MKSRLLVLVTLVFGATLGTLVASAHTQQQQPSHVFIYPRRDYLTVIVSGDRTDLMDVVSSDAHASTTSSAQKTTTQIENDAKNYVENHLFFEQGNQVLPLHAERVRFFDVQGSEEMNKQFEVFLRASRPHGTATTPLSIASDLFNGLGNARTLIVLGKEEKSIQGKTVIEFPAETTMPMLGNDMLDFAWSGALQTFQVGQILLLASLFLGMSLGTWRALPGILGAGIVGAGLSFLLDLTGHVQAPPALSQLGMALCIALAGGLSWMLGRRADTPSMSTVLSILAFGGGLAIGTSYAAPLRVWGLPEENLVACGLAFMLGTAVVQSLVAAILWPTLMHWRGKLTHQSNYGGMNWPRAVQIASLCCAALGVFYGVQHIFG